MPRRPDLTRRAFLGFVGQAGLVVGLAGIVYAAEQPHRFVRPPGALPERAFLALCVKCQKCQQVCPQGVITPVVIAQDIVLAGTPTLSFQRGYCDGCRRCIEVCPTGALQPIEKTAIRLGSARIDRTRCIAWDWQGCTRCYDQCPLDAIALEPDGRPTVDAAKCNGCGLCEYVCLSSALRKYTRGGKGVTIVPFDS